MNHLFEKILEESSYYNDTYTQSSDRYSFSYIEENFLESPENLAKYFYEHKDLLQASHQTDLYEAYYHYDEGFESFYKYAKEPFEESASLLKSLIRKSSGALTLYRGIVLVEDDELDLKKPGICWTYNKSFAEQFAKDLCINEDGFKETVVILKAKVPYKKIDWLLSALLNADEPYESEIRLFDDNNLDIEVDTL